tara:strand:+ start:1048 stop:1227 length:180 start_codon:yes stop_codon:yes gene_type:complete
MRVLLIIIFLFFTLFLKTESRSQENQDKKEINKKNTESKVFKPSEEISRDNNINLPSDI